MRRITGVRALCRISTRNLKDKDTERYHVEEQTLAFVDGIGEREFVEHLADTLGLDEKEKPRRREWSRVGNTIGALTLRLNLMNEAQVNEVLQIQDVEGGYFGEVAVRAGYLSPIQVESLLELQQLHDELLLGEQLVVAGQLDIPTLVNSLADFLNRRESTAVKMASRSD